MQQRLKNWLTRHGRTVEIWSIVVLGAVLYANILPNKLLWDDYDFFVHNQFVHDWSYFSHYFTDNLIAGSGLLDDYWRPMLLTVFSVQWHLWQGWPPGYHFVSAALHIADAILLLLFLRRLLGSRPLAYLTALFFLAHPLQTEAVAYASSQGDSLSVLFELLGLLCYLDFRSRKSAAGKSRRYWAAIGLFILALLSKETAIVFPALALLSDAYRSFRDQPGLGWRRRLAELGHAAWPFFLLAAVYVLLRGTVLNFVDSFNLTHQVSIFTSSFPVRLFTFFRVLAGYVGLLFVPLGLHMERQVEYVTSFFQPLALAGAAIFAVLLALAAALYRRRPALSFGIFWFFICLAPVSNVAVPINGLMYEHFLYLPLAGFFLALLAAGKELTARPVIRRAAVAALVVGLAVFSVLTVRRNADWRDPVVFFSQIRPYAPQSYRLLVNLGIAYADSGDQQAAVKTFKEALALQPILPVAHHNLANSYRALGDRKQAMDEYRAALAVDPGNRILYNAPVSLLLAEGKYQEALRLFEGFLPHSLNKVSAYFFLAKIALDGKDPQAALGYLRQAAAADPGNASIRQDIDKLEKLIGPLP